MFFRQFYKSSFSYNPLISVIRGSLVTKSFILFITTWAVYTQVLEYDADPNLFLPKCDGA